MESNDEETNLKAEIEKTLASIKHEFLGIKQQLNAIIDLTRDDGELLSELSTANQSLTKVAQGMQIRKTDVDKLHADLLKLSANPFTALEELLSSMGCEDTGT